MRNVAHQCFVVVLYPLIFLFVFCKVAEPAHLSKPCKTASFTVSNFGKEKKFHLAVILVTC